MRFVRSHTKQYSQYTLQHDNIETTFAVPSLWQPMLRGGGVLVAWDPVTHAAVISFQVHPTPLLSCRLIAIALLNGTLRARHFDCSL